MSAKAMNNKRVIVKVLGNLTFVYLCFKGFSYLGSKVICNTQRTQLLNYANGNTLLTDSFNRMTCAEIKTSYIYVFDFLKYGISLKVDNDLYNKIKLISINYHIFLNSK